MKLNFTTLLAFVFISLSLNAQTWQWIGRNGSGWQIPNSDEEEPFDITTDVYGNVYCVSLAYPNGTPSVDTNYLPHFGSNAGNVLLTSYTCEGKYRWSHILGSGSGSYAKSVKTDYEGNVYLFANIFTNGAPVYLDLDTIINGNQRNQYLFKFDSAGAMQWFTTPVTDTIDFFVAYGSSFPLDMDVDGAGNVTLISVLPKGNNLGGQITLNEPATYALRYNKDGVYQSGVPLPYTCTGLKASYRMSTRATVSDNGNIIISGYRFYIPQDTIFINGTMLKGKAYVASFSPTGQFLWKQEFKAHQGVIANEIFLHRAATDADNAVYLSGAAAHLDTIAGFVANNVLYQNAAGMPLILKLDANGNLVWAKAALVNAAAIASGVAVSNNKVAITGTYSLKLKWDLNATDSLAHTNNQGWDPFVAVFDAQTGTLLSLDSLTGNLGQTEWGWMVAADNNASFYVAGQFDQYINIGTGAVQAFGSWDTYIAKYGSDNCTFTIPNNVGEVTTSALDFELFPNPANTAAFVKLNTSVNGSLTLYSLTGQQLYSQVLSNSMSLLQLPLNYPVGIYFVTLTDNGKKVTKKLIVQ